MEPDLSYAAPRSQSNAGVGYLALILVNSVILFVGIFVFRLETRVDPFAKMDALIFGGPLLVIGLMLGAVPSWIYLGKQWGRLDMPYKIILLLCSIIPTVFGVTGFVISMRQPFVPGGC